jgi:hypothetical protein
LPVSVESVHPRRCRGGGLSLDPATQAHAAGLGGLAQALPGKIS